MRSVIGDDENHLDLRLCHTYENFKDFLSSCWSNQNVDLNVSQRKCQQELGEWNRNIFGNVEEKIRIILARLNGVQNSTNYPKSTFLNK